MAEITKVISKLSIDASDVYTELDKVNSKYEQSNAELRKQQTELQKLQAQEAELLKLRSKTQVPNVVAQFNKELEKTRSEMDKVNKSMKENQKATSDSVKETSSLKTNLEKAFDGTKVQSLRSQLKGLKDELSNLEEGTEEFEKVAAAAGQIQDKIKDATEASNVFATGSKIESARTLFHQLAGDIINLDFEGAAAKTRTFANVMSSISFREIIAGVKNFGSALVNLGRTLLAPPIGIVVAIAAAIYVLVQLGKKMYEASLQSQTLTDAIKEQSKALLEYRDRYEEAQLRIQELFGQVSEKEAARLRNEKKIRDESIKLQEDYAAKIIALAEELDLDLRGLSKNGFFADLGFIDTQREEKRKFNRERLELDKLYYQLAKEALKTNAKELEVTNAEININARKKREEEDKKREEELKAQGKKLTELLIANIEDETERKLAANDSAFNEEIEQFKDNALIVEQLRIKHAKEQEKIEKEAAEKITAARRKQREDEEKIFIERQEKLAEQREKRQAFLVDELNEQERHQLALLGIRTNGQEGQELLLLANQIAFQQQRLDQYKRFYGEESAEYAKQKNILLELEEQYEQKSKELDKERVLRIIDNIKVVTDAFIDAASKIIAIEEKRTSKLISIQEKRVEEAARIAENGNAELLELEKDRLEKLNKERERYVRAQQVLATAELIANTAVTVSKAASQGGAAAAVTIAAALIALVAGLASARSIAGQAAFFKGGESDGYTGNGSIYDESTALGNKPYIYHKKEFIFNNEKTTKYLDVFRKVHKGELDLNQIKYESDMYKALKANGIDTSRDVAIRSFNQQSEISGLKSSLKDVVEAINSQERLKVNIDDKGIEVIATKYMRNKKRINSIT